MLARFALSLSVGSGARVFAAEGDPAPCRRALKVFFVMSEIDLFVSSTGNFNISTLDHMKKLIHNAFVETPDTLTTRSTSLAQRAWKA